MSRTLKIAALALFMGIPAQAIAQVHVRAPFVQVDVNGPVGPGVHVRAPFVNIFIPSRQPQVYMAVPPAPQFLPPSPRAVFPEVPQPQPPLPPEPTPFEKLTPPQPSLPAPKIPPPFQDSSNEPQGPEPVKVSFPTIEQFAKNFQPTAGSYEVTLMNPVTNQPTTVRFQLPEGKPRVSWTRRDLEFDYGNRQIVRIQLDRNGAMVRQ